MSHWLWWPLYFLGHGILNSFACHHFLIVFHYPTCHLRGPGLCAKQSPLKKMIMHTLNRRSLSGFTLSPNFSFASSKLFNWKKFAIATWTCVRAFALLASLFSSLRLTSFSFTYNNVRKKRAVYRWAKLTALRFGLRSYPVLHCTSLLCIVWHMITAHENGSLFFIAEPNQRGNYFSFLKSKYSDLSFFRLFPTE